MLTGSGSGAREGKVGIWRHADGRLMGTLKATGNAVTHLVMHPRDPGMLVTAGDDRKIRIWEGELPDLQLRTTLTGHVGTVTSVTLSTREDLLLSASAAGEVKIWDRTTGHARCSLAAAQAGLSQIAFSPTEHHLIGCGGHRRLSIWSVKRLGLLPASPLANRQKPKPQRPLAQLLR